MLTGRVYEMMQNELDGDFSKMHVKVKFQITHTIGSDAITEFIGHEVAKDHIRRQVRRARSKVDDTVDVVTEDGFYIRIKPIIITHRTAKSSQKQEMRAGQETPFSKWALPQRGYQYRNPLWMEPWRTQSKIQFLRYTL